jgi:hypothetical protein
MAAVSRVPVAIGMAAMFVACRSKTDRGGSPEATGGCSPITHLLGYSESEIATWYEQNHFEPIELRILDLGPPKTAPRLVETVTFDGKTYTGVMQTEAACIQGDSHFGADAAGRIFMLALPGGRVDSNAHTCVTSTGKRPCETSGTTNRFYVFPDGKQFGGTCTLRECHPMEFSPGLCPADSDSPICHREVLHGGGTFSLVVSARAVGGAHGRDMRNLSSDLDAIIPGLERCYGDSKASPSSYGRPQIASITYSVDGNGAPRDFATVRSDPLGTCVLELARQQIPMKSNVGPAGAHMSIDASFFEREAWPAVAARRPSAAHAFPSLHAALAGDYRKFPAAQIPTQRHGYVNPVTGSHLLLDLSEGGGAACCEQPTFYVWFDPAEGLWWIRTYAASLRTVDDHWYGPFAED